MPFAARSRGLPAWAFAFALSACGICAAWAKRPPRQGNSSEQVGEVVATLATGRVTIISGQDGLIVAGVGNSFKPGSLPPLIVPLADGNVAVVLGADDWLEPPPAGRTLLRLDQQLPHLTRAMAGNAPSLNPVANITHLDQMSLAVLEPLRAVARNLHTQLHLPQDLPLVELVLVRQTEQEPLLVWDVSYWIRQTFWQENFWDTEVERPRSIQLYPAKQDRSGIVQVSYPPGDTSPGLVAWLSHPTGRFAQAIQADPQLAQAQQEIASGRTKKIKMVQLVPLVKTALETLTPSTAVKALAAVDEKSGFAWVIRPPVSRAPVKRPAGAPTLEPPPDLE
ncbi:MAG TPA: hypothetical protein VNJ52_08955 [Patescibacteria group bacterium]|nr:hypothetical protein [Patescibacteria group bacterium]